MSRLTEINKDACDLCNLDCKHMDNSCEKAKIYNKLKYYEDLEEETEKIWGDGASITKLVNSLNKCACSADGYLDFARILTNDDAEKWLRWKELAKQGRLIELPCKVGDAVYEILPPCNDTLLCEMFQQLYISRCLNKECGHYIQIKQFRIELLKDLGRTVFATKAEAEVKLAELKGNL